MRSHTAWTQGAYIHTWHLTCFWGAQSGTRPLSALRSRFFLIAIAISASPPKLRGAESMVMEFHGNVQGEVRVNFLALFASKPRIFMCGALKLSGIVRANVRLNIAIPMLFLSLTNNQKIVEG